MRSPTRAALVLLASLTLLERGAEAATLIKLFDFNNSGDLESIQNPYDTPLVIGSELWFTSENGGETGFGTISTYDLSSNILTIRTNLGVPDSETFYDQGNTPTSSIAKDGDRLYYTTSRGGTGDQGTLNAYNLTTGSTTVLWNSPSNDPNTNPNTPSGSVAVVDRGAAGKDIYFMTGNGGPGNGTTGSGYGTIQRHNTVTGLTSTVFNFTGGVNGKQPFEGFTRVGNSLYFTTFTGGNSGTGTTNGAGTLSVLDISTSGSESLTQLAAMPLGDGSTRLPAHNPFYSVARNSLFITTTGTATQPGSLQSFDLTTNTLTTLYELTGAATASGPFPDGRFIYGPVYEWGDSLYYTTIQGGLYGGGTINQFDLLTSTNTVLFNLDSRDDDNYGGEARGGFAFSDFDGDPALYLLTRQGGDYDHGTILKLSLVPEPSRGVLLMAGMALIMSHRSRRKTSTEA